MKRVVVGIAVALLASACASGIPTGGTRPPQGPGPAGTQFGFWDRDADASVDASFRAYITRTYDSGDEARARTALETDGFECKDGNRPDGRPVPVLECERLYSDNEIVHTWTVEFWPNEREPRAHYSRIQRRDDLKNHDEKKKRPAGLSGMSFVLAPHETPGAGLTRVITEQVAKLSVECVEAGQDPSAFAHKARVRCKRIRAALRLARPLIGDKVFRKQNQWWRDQARLLSELRDAGARLEALDTLRPFLASRIGTAMTRKLGERFETNRTQVDAAAAIAAFTGAMDQRADDLIPHIEDGGRDAMAVALGETYKLARLSMKAALENEKPELLHEWRKQAKYHALQARLLRLTFPDALDQRVAAVRDLAGLLGEAQDIEVVKIGAKGWREAPRGFRDVLEVRRKALVTGARATGAALFAEKPKAWMKQLSPPVMADE